MKKHQRKGFTLVELIIVIALFSIIMYSVLQLMDPVSKFFVRSSNFEEKNACIDNLKLSIEGNLKFADRIRAYYGYEPYVYTGGTGGALKTSDYEPTTIASKGAASLEQHVMNFYDEFFKDRKFMDAKGVIYVLCFDNTEIASDSTLANYGLLSDLTDNGLNSGKIVMYEYAFDNYDSDGDGNFLNPTPEKKVWYVNQDLYGAFEYHYSLGDREWKGTTGDTEYVFDPQNFTIRITANHIKKSSEGLTRENETEITIATFSMKNVLNASRGYSEPLNDFVVKENPSAANLLEKYTIDVTHPVPRYQTMEVDAAKSFDGFYFIFTVPETTVDVKDVTYISAVEAAKTATTTSTTATTP